MQLNLNWKTASVGLLLASACVTAGMAANTYTRPKSVVHVITMAFKDGTTDAQKQSAEAAFEKMAAQVPGIEHIWLKTAKAQGQFMDKQPDGSYKPRPITNIFVIEFKDQASFDKYADSPAHKEFEKVYLPLRERSWTHDVTN
jgi:hypothetical protein